MNMLERFLGHDQAMTHDILQRCLALSDEEMDRQFDVGLGTLRVTFEHMIHNIEVWTDLMMARAIHPSAEKASASQFLERLERGYGDFAAFAKQVETEGRLDELWLDVLNDPPKEKSFGGAICHVITHNMHHRAEALHLMARLGMKDLPEGDLMGWDQRRRLADARKIGQDG